MVDAGASSYLPMVANVEGFLTIVLEFAIAEMFMSWNPVNAASQVFTLRKLACWGSTTAWHFTQP